MLKLQLYPSDVLLRHAEPVTAFDQGLIELCDAMLELMLEKQGVGLAAPQVNESKRIFVMRRLDERLPPIVAVNPVVSPYGNLVGHYEGCLSVPGVQVWVERPRQVVLRYQEPATGEWNEVDLSDTEAFCAQHELDHCDGIMLFDRKRVSRQTNRQALREWDKEKARRGL
jgi:peptide deformylase